MALHSLLYGLLLIGCILQVLTTTSSDHVLEYMSREEREALKEEARDMFYHAYNAYMDNAYPADELMPLSCKGRYRGSEPNRGDIDSTLGNFSLTLVDTLDTLVVLGDLEEFENAVKLVVRDVNFDTDVIVSLFETNIRMLGGLLSGHILAEYLQQRADIMPWYRGELLNLAKDLGYRFLPAFNTTTGIPYGRINLKYGMKGVPSEVSRETCTACAGSMILEMAALSRLTGEMIFEEKAQKAMDVLWRMRHRGTDLMGTVLNVHSGDWVRRDSGVGAGIDSYYEYCLKAYILLGDEKYLGRFNKHYQAIMKYVSQGPMLLDVHMHRPNTNSKNFMDALLAFWPGLQVLKGDIKPAVETHEMLYQVMQRHNFIPEAFTTDFQVHWGHHPLRPEFLESTYFLYRATGDHYYLGVGRKVLKSLQTYARVPCGYAAVSDVRTNKHDDTMDSFVLSETFKYLFLLFAEPNELVLDLDEFIFTTEGHLLPLTLASVRMNITSQEFERDVVHVGEFDRTCPNSLHLFPASVRQPLRNMVEDVCPKRTIKRKLSASQFQANNLEHLKLLSDMGITILTLADGRVQLLHTFSNAKTPQDSEEGLLFMQEMAELSRMQSQQTIVTKPQSVSFTIPDTNPEERVTLLAGPARFGPELQNFNKVIGKLVFTYPGAACTELVNEEHLKGKIAIVERGNCMFIEKARRIQKAGAIAGIVLDNVLDSSAATSPMFAMSGDGKEVDDVKIPVVFLFNKEAGRLIKALIAANGELSVTIGEFSSEDELQLKAPTDLSMFERIRGSIKSFLSQQAAPQNPETSGPNKGIVALESSETKEIEKDKEMKPKSIDYRHLHAEIIDDSLGGEVRITITSNPDQVAEESEDLTTLEKQWKQLKEAFLTFLFTAHSLDKDNVNVLKLRTSILLNYYDWVMKGRNADNASSSADKSDISSVALWFLKELSKVTPNHWIAFDQTKIMDTTRQKLLKQHLFTKLDIIVLNLRTISNKIKNIKAMKPEMSHLLKLTESRTQQLENYTLRLLQDMKELYDSIDGEDESISQHIALVDPFYTFVHTLYQSILVDGMQKNLAKSETDEIFYDKTMEWYINRIQGSPKKSIKEHSMQEMNIGKFDDFEYHILMEIQKVVKNSMRKTLQKITKANQKTEQTHTELPDHEDKVEKQGEVIRSLADNQTANNKNTESQDLLPKDEHTSKKDVNNNESLIKSENNVNINVVHGSIDEQPVSNENQKDLQGSQNNLQDESDVNECTAENLHDKNSAFTEVVDRLDDSQEESEITNAARDTTQQSDAINRERPGEPTTNEDVKEHVPRHVNNEL